MAKLKYGNSFYGGENEIVEYNNENEFNAQSFLPVSGGRSSIPETISTFAPSNKLIEIPMDFAVEWLTTLENLAAYHSDISYALDNIVQLANTPHEIYFADNVKSSMVSKMKAHLLEKEKLWYENSGGMRSLKADLLAQIVINGALSAEAYPDSKLKGIEQVVRVSPKNIRFIYDREAGRHMPYQTNLSAKGIIPLNTKTYKYIALRRFFQTPYATPPFISAIDALCTQKDMLANFKNIMQKLGMLGFLSAEVSPPTQKPNESQEAYWQRCVDYLNNTVYPQLQKNLGKGMVAGFKDKHKFELQGNNMNVSGAEGLFNLVQSRIFAAVKQDPNMLGVNMATTETFGRVILAKLLSQVEDYQSVVDTFIEQVYEMELTLAGYNPGAIKVVSGKPLIGDKIKEEQAEQTKIANVRTKRDMGIISQEQAANELGYEQPYEDGDITQASEVKPTNIEPDGKTDPSAGDNNDSNVKANIKSLEYKLKKQVKEYDYCNNHKCGQQIDKSNFQSFTKFEGTDLEKYIKKYFKEIFSEYKKASNSIGGTLGKKLLKYNENTPIEVIQREAYLHILMKWEGEFVTPMKDVIENNITNVWEHFRKDKKVFESKQKGYSKQMFDDAPEASLDLDDFRAIQYMEDSDTMYLGKFITDKDTKNAVYKYLQEQYIEGYLPIGNNESALNQFSKTFENMLNLEAWKIRRIIDTTMNKVRNYARIYYMDQAMVEKYEVLEIIDNLTCEYCAEMDGKVFEVKATKDKIKREVNAGPENVSSVSPFITSEKIDDIKGKTAEELASLGYDTPSYHPHCRGTTIATF